MNSFVQTCPECQSPVQIESHLAGETLECPLCGGLFLADTPPIPTDSNPPERKRPSRRTWAFVGAAAAALALLALFALKGFSSPSSALQALERIDHRETGVLIYDAKEGAPNAQFNLGRLLETGQEGIAPSLEEARDWYLRASEQDHGEAQLAAGSLLLMSGKVEEARFWLKKAADQDVVEAQRFLSVLYQGNEGFPEDLEKSTEWLLRAANLGDPQAQFDVGLAFATGRGVEKNQLLCEHWVTMAAAQGHPDALLRIKLQPQPFPTDTDVLQERVILRKQEELRRGGATASPFSSPSPSRYVPPQFEEARRRAEGGYP